MFLTTYIQTQFYYLYKFSLLDILIIFHFYIRQTHHRRVERSGDKTYPDDTPEFDRGSVSLDLPDQLFNQALTLVTNVSKTISKFIMVRNFVDIFG